MVEVKPNSALFLGKESNTAYLEIDAISMNETTTEELGVRFSHIISDMAGIDFNRIFVRFNMTNPVDWILRGHTSAY